jgi:hypothetical protein
MFSANVLHNNKHHHFDISVNENTSCQDHDVRYGRYNGSVYTLVLIQPDQIGGIEQLLMATGKTAMS